VWVVLSRTIPRIVPIEVRNRHRRERPFKYDAVHPLPGLESMGEHTRIRSGSSTRAVRIVGVGMLIVLSTLVLTAAPQAAAAVNCNVEPHGPILIARDADFTAANGVVSGSGTAKDPFLIANLQLKDLSPGFGLKIDNSKGKITKFFNIDCVQSNWTNAPPKGAILVSIANVHTATKISRVDANSGEAGGSVAIRVDGSSFIVLDNESIDKFGSDGVQLNAADHITVIDSKLKAFGNGLTITGSHDITVGQTCNLASGSGCNDFTYDDGRGIFLHDSYNVLVQYTITAADDTGGILLDGSGTYNVTLLNGDATANGPICPAGSPTGLITDTEAGIAVTNGAHDIAVHGYSIQANGNGAGGFFDIMNGGNGLWMNPCTFAITKLHATPPGGANLDFSGNCYHFEFGFNPVPPSTC
jgi:Right handed beta helix region